MRPFRRFILLTLSLLITLSATGVNVSLHRCCGKIKNFTLLGDNKVCAMAQQPMSSSGSGKHHTSASHKGHSCCQDQKISVHNDLQASLQKSQVNEKHVQPLLFTLDWLTVWFKTDQLPVLRFKPLFISYISDPLIILLQQFRI